MRGRLTHQHIDDLEIQRIQRAIAVIIKFVGGNRTISGDDEPVVDHHIGAIQVAIRALSGGNQQKVVLAREVDLGRRLLVFNQPTRGLDMGAVDRIHKVILQERESGKAVLMISTELSEIFALCDRVAVMYKGRMMGIYENGSRSAAQIGLLMAGISEEQEGAQA